MSSTDEDCRPKPSSPPPELEPFPEKWPIHPILPMCSGAHFWRCFELQVHPQTIVISRNDQRIFGIKNPTEKHVLIQLEMSGNGDDVTFEKAKDGKKIDDKMVIKPGEILTLVAVHKEEIVYDERSRKLEISYYNLENEEDIKKAKTNGAKDLKKEIEGKYVSWITVDPEPPLKPRPKPPRVPVYYDDLYDPEHYNPDLYGTEIVYRQK